MFPNTPLKLENRCYSSPTCYQDSEHEFQSMPWSTDHPTQWHYSKCHIWDIPTTKNHPMTKTTTQEAQQLRASYIKTSYKPLKRINQKGTNTKQFNEHWKLQILRQHSRNTFFCLLITRWFIGLINLFACSYPVKQFIPNWMTKLVYATMSIGQYLSSYMMINLTMRMNSGKRIIT